MSPDGDTPFESPARRLRHLRGTKPRLWRHHQNVNRLLKRGRPARRRLVDGVVGVGCDGPDNASPIAGVRRFEALDGDGGLDDVAGQQSLTGVNIFGVARVDGFAFD